MTPGLTRIFRLAPLRVAVFFAILRNAVPLLGQAPSASESSNASPVLSLGEARQIALEKNWDLLAAKSGIDSAQAQLIVAREFPNPSLSLSTAKIGSHESATFLGNSIQHRSYDSIAAVSQLIEIAGKRGDRQAAGRAAVLGARARFFDARRLLDQGVTKAYVAALLADSNARLLTESASYLRRQATIAGAQNAAGDLAEADMKALEINAEQFELQAKAAAANAVQARIAVEILLSFEHPAGLWRPTELLEKFIETAAVAPAVYPARDGAVRSDVLAAVADLRAGQAQLRLQKALRIPDPTFAVGVEHEPPGGGPPVDTFNLAVSFPLPLWNRNGGNIKAAQAAVAQYEIALGKLKTQAAADVASAELAYREAYERWLRYRDETVPKSAKVREAIQMKYEKGAATLVDFLNAEQTDNSVRLAAAQAMGDTASAAADLVAARKVVSEKELNNVK